MDMEQALLLAATRAKKIVDEIEGEGRRADYLKNELEKNIHGWVKNALAGEVPIEDAILHFNEMTGEEEPCTPMAIPTG